MAATIHPLFPGATARAAAELPAWVHVLRATTLGALKDSLRLLFDRADDLLFEMGEKASNDSERRRYFDTMRVLRLESSRVTRTFAREFLCGFVPAAAASAVNPGVLDLDQLAILPTEELEERIAIANLAAKAEGLFRNASWELERRLDIAVHELAVPVASRALNPSRICAALGAAIGELDTGFQIKLVIYKLLDRSVLRDFERVYALALELLDRHEIGSTGESGAHIDAAPPSGDLIRQFGGDADRLRATNMPASTELRRLLQTLLSNASVLQTSRQRLAMAGQLLRELLAEPLLPPALRSTIEDLRFPIYRSALTEASFFSETVHPLRTLLSDLVESAVNAQTGSAAAAAQLTELLDRIASVSGSAGVKLSQLALPTVSPLASAEADQFLLQLREQTRARREALLMRVRRLIAQELELRTLGRAVPPAAMKLLRGGIGPLMAVRLLRNGGGSTAFQQARDLLDRTLLSLEFPAMPSVEELRSREELQTAIRAALEDIGMEPDKIETLLRGLQDVYARNNGDEMFGPLSLTVEEERLLRSEVEPADAMDGNAAAARLPPSTTALELLGEILKPESWYRVFDAEQNKTRWLKLASFHPQHDSILFSGFDDSTTLCLRALRFAEDLVHGFSEPINPGSAARGGLARLREAKVRGVF